MSMEFFWKKSRLIAGVILVLIGIIIMAGMIYHMAVTASSDTGELADYGFTRGGIVLGMVITVSGGLLIIYSRDFIIK